MKNPDSTVDLFGTAGIRRKIGKEINEINVEFVYRLVFAVAAFLQQKNGAGERRILICRDNRHFSYEFALAAAKAMADQQFKPLFISDIMPSPFLSYGTKKLQCALGIMITASHNPKEDNGLKIYSATGALLLPCECAAISRLYLEKYQALAVPELNFPALAQAFTDKDSESQLINDYMADLKAFGQSLGLNPTKISADIRVGFSPQHGTAYKIVPALLKALKVTCFTEPVQGKVDPDFSGTPSPDPGDARSFLRLKKLARQEQLNLLLATDPDADRLAVGVKRNGKFRLLTGNEVAIIMFGFLISQKPKLTKHCWAAGSLVSTAAVATMAAANGIPYYETNTGFKWIGHLVESLPNQNLILGFEESMGYLVNPDLAHDKDGIQSLLLITAIAMKLHQQSMTLIDFLNTLKSKYRFESNYQLVVTGANLHYQTAITALVKIFNQQPLAIWSIANTIDFAENKTAYLQSNSGKLIFNDGSWVMVRSSGTENGKLRFYLAIRKPNVSKKLAALKLAIKALEK